MNRIFAALLLVLGLANTAGAACTWTTGVLPLEIPRLGDSGATWAACLQRDLEKISVGGGGHFIEGAGTPVIQRSTMNFTGTGVTVLDIGGKTEVAIQGGSGDVIRSTHVKVGEVITASVGWEPVLGSTAAVYTEVSAFLGVRFTCNLECDSYTSCPVHFGLMIDGDFAEGITSDINSGFSFVKTDGMEIASPETIDLAYRTENKVSASTHTLTLLWASPTGRQVRMARNTSGCALSYYNDLNTVNSGSIANVLGVINYGAQTLASIRTLTCPVLPCLAQTTFELYRATGTLPGEWASVGTNVAP